MIVHITIYLPEDVESEEQALDWMEDHCVIPSDAEVIIESESEEDAA